MPDPVDVLIIGGGIVGAGVARDAAMRGLRTRLIEQQDFAAGTSGRSSRLLHGGIRYLAQGRVGLVREASREKTVVHQIAPHLSDPLAFIFPTRSRSPWSKWKLGIGVKVYDLLCRGRNLGPSRVLNRTATLDLLPGLSQANLTGAVRYYDGLTNDARLTIDTLRSAANAGAVVDNYVRFVDAEHDGQLWQCRCVAIEGSQPADSIAARCVVNAAGPWSHQIPNSRSSLRLTKGVHLVIDHDRLPVPDAVVMVEGPRILFVIPWGERVIVGTTDTDYDGPIGAPECEVADTRYVLGVVNDSFPESRITEGDVISTWAGLRPLVATSGGDPSDISRRHEITMGHPGWWDVCGGKLTTYRLMAEETVDAMARHLKVRLPKCQTAAVPLLRVEESEGVSGILPPPVTSDAVEHYCRQEWARHLEDVMVRRTSWRYYHRNHLELAEQVAGWMGQYLGWDDQRTHSEFEEYRRATTSAERSDSA